MRISRRNAVLVAGAAAVLALVAIVAVVADATGLAIVCVAILQAGLVGLVLVGVLHSDGVDQRLRHHEKALHSLDRRVTNMARRSVAESQATERSITARLDELRQTLDPSGADRAQD